MKIKKNSYFELLEIPPGHLNIMGYVLNPVLKDRITWASDQTEFTFLKMAVALLRAI